MTSLLKLTMQTAKVSDGVDLAFLDSWQHVPMADRPASYRTIIAVHGVGFNSGVWRPLFAHLPAGVRFIAYNQRAYAHSSPALAAQKPGGTDVAAAYTLDLFDFMKFVIDHLGVSDGIVLLGWSKGAVVALSALAALDEGHNAHSASFLSSHPPELDLHGAYPFMKTQLECVMLYDAPSHALGQGLTPDALAALLPVFPPNQATPLEIGAAFGKWIVNYSGENTSKLPPSSLSDLLRLVGDDAWEPLTVGGGLSWEMGSAEETERLAKAAIINGRVPIGLVYGENTVEFCKSGERTVREWAAESGKELKLAVVEGANHFAMILKPNEFTETLLSLIAQLN